MDNHKYCVGDKFIIEIGSSFWSPNIGNRYLIRGFDTLVFDDKGLNRLEKYKAPPKEIPHTCEFCVYQSIGMDAYPCSRCDKNDEPKDMFEVMK